MKNIALDLDNTVFDLEPVYKMGFNDKKDYYPPVSWAVYECYPRDIGERIIMGFRTLPGYSTPLINKKYPSLIADWDLLYNLKVVTSRQSIYPDVDYMGKKISWAKFQTYNQLKTNNILIPIENIIVTDSHSKIKAFRDNKIDLVIDDGPVTIEECLDNKIDCVMISNEKTLYNHYLRSKTQWAKDLFDVAKMKSL